MADTYLRQTPLAHLHLDARAANEATDPITGVHIGERPLLGMVNLRGQRISQAEKDAYPPGLVVLWQPKAWVDRPTAEAWAKQVWKPFIDVERAAGVAGGGG